MRGRIDLEGGPLKAMLLTSAYTPDLVRHARRSDLWGEAVGPGYEAGGVPLGRREIVCQPDGRAETRCPTTWFRRAKVTARYLAVYQSHGAPDTDELVLMHVFVD